MILRPRLSERLRVGTRGPLTVVTGPPGSGKTVTVALWAAIETRPPGPVAWVCFDDMAESGQGLGPALSEGFALAGMDLPGVIMPGAFDETAVFLAGLDAAPVLVLDGFQPGRDAAIAEDVARLLNHAGPGLRIVLTSRADPPLPLNRYRLAGELTEIRSADLAFRESEIAAVLARHGVRLGATALRSLRDRTEGWAAGVRLAAISMQAHPAPETFGEQFCGDDRTVVEYVQDEVLAAQPPGLRRLLLVTSVVERVNAELAAGLAGDEAGRAFSEMVRQNSFILPLGHGWYRYHSMFGQALRAILRHESPAEARELHRWAAGRLDRAGLLTEAVRQAALAGDWSHASWLAVNRLAIGQVLGLRQEDGLARCFTDMPAEFVRTTSEPEPAIVAAATALAGGDERSCASLLRHAETVLRELPDDGGRTARLSAGIVRQILSGCTGPVVAAGTAATGPALLPEFSDQLLGDRPELRALFLLCQGTGCLHDGELREASRVLGEAVTAAPAGGDFLRRVCLGRLALTEALLGRFTRATACAAQAAQPPAPPRSPPTALAGRRVAALHLATAWSDLERGRFDDARTELERTAQVLGEQPDDFVSAVLRMVRARLDLSQGQPERALDALRSPAAASPCQAWLERRLTLAASAAHSACGAAGAARAAAERAGGTRTLESTIALTRATLCDGDALAAAETLRPILGGSASAPVDIRVDGWLLDSYLSYRTGDGSRGRRSLDHALRLAGREQVSLPFTLAKDWLCPVLRQDPEISKPYRRLLEPIMLVTGPGSTGPAQEEAPAAVTAERLSSRELDVLRNLAQMMTTEEIARELCLSLNTVKTHLKSIYRKLGVTRRGEAVRRARHLELL